MGRGSSFGGGGGRGFSGGGSIRPSGGGFHPHPSGGGFFRGMMVGGFLFGRRRPANDVAEGNAKYKKTRNKLATLIVGLIFLAVAVAGFVCANIFTYKATTGEVVSYREADVYGYTCYYATYKYNVKGQDYLSESLVCFDYDGGNPANIEAYQIGSTQRIMYKNTDPSRIYEPEGSEWIDDNYSAIWYVVAVIGLIAAIITFAVGINKTELIEETTAGTGASTDASTQASKSEGKEKCKYCGCVMGKDDEYCSGCGARRSY